MPKDAKIRDVLVNPISDQTLMSPNYPGNYPHNGQTLYWALKAEDTDKKIQLYFESFKLSLDDHLTVSLMNR